MGTPDHPIPTLDQAAHITPRPDSHDVVDAWRQPAEVRTRTVTWDDPRAGALHALERSGIDHIRAILAAEVPAPPIALLLGFATTEVSEGEVVMETEPGEHQYNPIGTVHGGVIATLLDSAMGCAVQSTLPAGTGYTTSDLQVRFVRPVLADTGRLRCTGRIVHRGRRTATAEGDLRDAAGKLY
ncbi:MAG TPA: PaaI family thioesterase, partial [Nitriliruptorales bacterium]